MGGPDSGIWRSTDGGDTWEDLTRNPGLPQTGDLGRIGAYVRAMADLGADQLRNLSDEQIGAIAVSLWRTQNRDSFLGRRVRRAFWRGTK